MILQCNVEFKLDSQRRHRKVIIAYKNSYDP